jgi:hypothetical protein
MFDVLFNLVVSSFSPPGRPKGANHLFSRLTTLVGVTRNVLWRFYDSLHAVHAPHSRMETRGGCAFCCASRSSGHNTGTECFQVCRGQASRVKDIRMEDAQFYGEFLLLHG